MGHELALYLAEAVHAAAYVQQAIRIEHAYITGAEPLATGLCDGGLMQVVLQHAGAAQPDDAGLGEWQDAVFLLQIHDAHGSAGQGDAHAAGGG